jgi:RecG-like helicase
MNFYQKKSGADGNAFLGGFTVAEIAARSTQTEQLQTSGKLEFLQTNRKIENIFDKKYWSLYENGKPISPLKFSNGKTQENIVEEIVSHIKNGAKIILLHGACGTGKSAIALNIARVLGKTSIVVPIKSLQRQYEEDYTQKKYLAKSNGEKMKIALITGRENHDSVIEPGKSCAEPFLPDTIKFTEKNRVKITEY